MAARTAPPAAPLPSASPAPAKASAVATWIAVGGLSTRGLLLPEGRLALLGGRRVLVRTDGSVEPEHVPMREPLFDLESVPTAHGDRVVGLAMHTLYRFDEPLGAPTVLCTASDGFGWMGAGPGFVALGHPALTELPLFVDPDTGAEESPPPGWPKLPIGRMAFRSLGEGVVDFWAVGPQSTADGGKTFHPIHETAPADAPKALGMVRVGSEIRIWHGTGYSVVDPATGAATGYTLDPPEHTPTLRWLQKTHADPLAEALSGGIVVDQGRAAVVQRGGLVAKVDLAHGAIDELVELDWSHCTIGTHGGEGLLACPGHPLQAFPLAGPLRLRAQATTSPLFAGSNWEPNGGLVIAAGCKEDGPDDTVCALQPDGSLESVPLLPWTGYGGSKAQALASLPDGRVAVLRDTSASEDKPRVFIADKRGVIVQLPAMSLPEGESSAEVLGRLELGPDQALHALLSVHSADESHSLLALRQPVDGSPPTLTPVEGQKGMLSGGHAIAYDERNVRVSEDFGTTWTPLREVTPSLLDADELFNIRIPWLAAYRQRLAVGPLGVLFDFRARLGWGGEVAMAPQPAAASHATSLRWPGTKVRSLSCTTHATGAPAPPADDEARRKSLGGKQANLAPKGPRRSETYKVGSRYEQAPAMLESTAPAGAERPSAWTLRWVDPLEPGARARAWRGTPFAHADFYSSLEAVVAKRGRMVFAVTGEGETELVDVAASGATRRTTVGGALLGTLRIGATPGSPVVWLSRAREVMAWAAGEAPRAVASYVASWTPPSGVELALGTPTRDAVPLTVFDGPRVLSRTLPLHGRNERIDAEGWTSIDLDTDLPTCAKGVEGEILVPGPQEATVVVDGVEKRAPGLVYVLHVTPGASACIAGFRSEVEEAAHREGAAKGPHLVFLDVPTLDAGTGYEAGKGAQLRAARCNL